MFGICKHRKYAIISCIASEKKYLVKCMKCNKQFELPKAKGEMYQIGQIIDGNTRY